MITEAQNYEISEALLNEEAMSAEIEVPLQKMFDEMLVFISKSDFE